MFTKLNCTILERCILCLYNHVRINPLVSIQNNKAITFIIRYRLQSLALSTKVTLYLDLPILR